MSSVTDTCIAACYYNPTNSKTRKSNFFKFYTALDVSDVPIFVVELLFPGQKSDLDGKVTNLHVIKSGAVAWQKERLLNKLISMLPAQYTKVVWTDIDILFGENPGEWLEKISHALENSVVVQGFEKIERLPRFGRNLFRSNTAISFGKIWSNSNRSKSIVGDYSNHGHTGYTWAARREFLEECGLYDCCMSGTGDHLMAHAFVADLDAWCVAAVFEGNDKYRDHFHLWAEQAAEKTGGQIGFVDVDLTHLWHGNSRNRKHRLRDAELNVLKFDPSQDLVTTSNGTWEWSSKGRRLVPWAKEFFRARKEP